MTDTATETPITDQPDDKPQDKPDTGEKDWAAEAEKWKALARKHEGTAKANADAAKRLAEIEDANASELEKAVKAARAEGETEATKRANARLIAAEARALAAEAKFRNPALAVKTVDLSGVTVGDDGEVDSVAIKAALEDLAQSDPYLVGEEPPKPPPSFGGGPRPTPPTPTDPRAADLAQIEADLNAAKRRTT
jgi:hypothetical protein